MYYNHFYCILSEDRICICNLKSKYMNMFLDFEKVATVILIRFRMAVPLTALNLR